MAARFAAVLAAVAWWLIVAPRWWGGRSPGAVTGGALLTAIAVLVTRPDQVLPKRAVWLAGWLSAAAILVAVVAPTGWAGARVAASYVSVSWALLAVAAGVVQDPRLVDAILLVATAGVLVEIEEAWLPWWGSGSSTTPMIGTFYWWNPFAVYLLPGSVFGLTLWMRQRRWLAGFGLAACALGSIGLVYSTSRAVAACFIVAIVAVAASQIWQARWRAAARLAVAVGVTAFGVWAIAGPPFFSHRAAPLAATAARSAHQSVGQNTGYRLEFWREAIGVFSRHPITGSGYHGLAAASVGHVPKGWALSFSPHNGYLRALSSGGLILSVPFLLGCGIIGWYVVSALIAAARRRDFSLRQFVLPLMLAAVMLHAGVDFDWTYPADFALAAVLAGIVCGQRWSRQVPQRARRPATFCVVLVGVGLLGLSAYVARAGDLHLNLPISHSASAVTR